MHLKMSCTLFVRYTRGIGAGDLFVYGTHLASDAVYAHVGRVGLHRDAAEAA